MTRGTDFSKNLDYRDTAVSTRESDMNGQNNTDKKPENDLFAQEKVASYRLMTLLGRDIRTQMHSILGLTELYMDSDTTDKDLAGDFYGKLLMSESLIMDILDDTLELGNLMREDEKGLKDLVSLFEIFANLEDDISPRLALKGITLSVEMEDLKHSEGLVQEQLYYGALLRLVRFLVHHMRRGEDLQIIVREEENDEESFEVIVCVRVNHFGISLAQMGRMLHRYEKLSSEIHRSRDEIDLGIVVMKRYLMALDGEILCENTEEGGLLFTVRTRMNYTAFGEPEVPARHGEDRETPDFSGMKALIIDDDVINLEVGIRLLQNTGLQVTGAASGEEGLRIFKENHEDFDVILLDIRMPGLNGLEVARRIRGSNVPIIAMSSNSTEEDIRLSREAGIDVHMVKPIDSWSLYSVLKQYLN